MKKTVFFILAAAMAFQLSGTTRFVIDKGHFSPIVTIRFDLKRGLIFSAEEKGAISIWNESDETLRNHFQLTSNQIDRILVSPVNTNIAVLSHDSDKYYLSVWDWTTEKKIFTRIIEEQPLFIQYSATGKYLFYGSVKNPSLTFLNAINGVQLNYMNMLPSIYDFGYLGSSERNLMTYSSSGSIRFYDFRTSEEKLSVSTIPDLEDLNVIQSNNEFMSGRKGNELYLIDRLKGTAADTVKFHELKEFYQNCDNGHALTLERVNRNYVLKNWSTDNNNFTELGQTITLPITHTLTALVETGGITLVGDDQGSLYKVDWDNHKLLPFSLNRIKKISDMTVKGDTMTLCGNDDLLTIKAPFFNGSLSTTVEPVFEKTKPYLNGEKGIRQLEDGTFLFWTKGTDTPVVDIVGKDGKEEFRYDSFSSEIQDITYETGKIITLEKNGTITIIDRSTGKSLFSYSAIGLQDISLVNSRTLFAGRSSTGNGSPGVTIDLKTRETLTVQDDRFLIFDSMAVENSHQFYSLGLLNDKGKIKTILKRHDYNDLNKSETILIYTGEDINAQVVVAEDGSGTIFAKLGNSGIYRIAGRSVIKFDNIKPVRKIFLDGNILYSLNEDNTLSLFNISTGKLLYSIYIFNDDAWALIPASSDMYFGSQGVEDRIICYRNNRMINLKPANSK